MDLNIEQKPIGLLNLVQKSKQMRIVKAKLTDLDALINLAVTTFKESHGHSAPSADINAYINRHYTIAQFTAELLDKNSVYYLYYNHEGLVGYSKLTYNCPTAQLTNTNVAKLERIYVLESLHGKKIGLKLLHFNVALAKEHRQAGIWLYTWIENKKAIQFYERFGFRQIGRHDFRISENHSNPNWQYYLALQ